MHGHKHVRPLLAATAGAAVALALAGAAGAHHAITLNYDSEKTGTIEGVIQEVFWANPHVHIYLTVTKEDGSTQLWDMETGNLNVMRSRKLTKADFKIGDKVKATGLLGRDGHPEILANTLVKADGTVLFGNPEAQPSPAAYGEVEKKTDE